MQYLFVYGTLRPNHENAHLLEKIGGEWLKATVKGRLHVLDWGPDQGLFAVTLEDNIAAVEGYIFSSIHLDEHWNDLDAFEGFQYQRVQTQAILASGAFITVWIYVMNPHAKEMF